MTWIVSDFLPSIKISQLVVANYMNPPVTSVVGDGCSVDDDITSSLEILRMSSTFCGSG